MHRYQKLWRTKSVPESEKFNKNQMLAAEGESSANPSV